MCSLRFENNLLTIEGVRFASISKKTPLSKLSFAFVSLALPLLNKLLHSLLDGKNNEQRHVLDRHPNRSNDHPTVCDQDSVRIC